MPDARLTVSGEELAAKSRIAAALIAAKEVTVRNVDPSKPWMEQSDLVKFNRIVQVLYDAIQSNR